MGRRFRRAVAMAIAAAFVVLAAQGCNTLRGLGKDIQKVGEKIQKAANHKPAVEKRKESE